MQYRLLIPLGVAIVVLLGMMAVLSMVDSDVSSCIECATATPEPGWGETSEEDNGSEVSGIALVLLLGIGAATLVAGARAATRR